MQLIDQHTKAIMEGCKERARDAGLRFEDETLEYIVTNRDLLELSPKAMIPTMYDYWVHDVEVLREGTQCFTGLGKILGTCLDLTRQAPVPEDCAAEYEQNAREYRGSGHKHTAPSNGIRITGVDPFVKDE